MSLSGVTSHFEYVSQCQSDVGHLFVEPVWPTSLNMYGGSSRLWLEVLFSVFFFSFYVFFFLVMPGGVKS